MGRGRGGNTGNKEIPKETKSGGKAEDIKNVETLKNIEDRRLYREVTQGISRMAATLGMRERNIKLAEFKGASGVQFTSLLTGENAGIYLNSALFKKGTVSSVGKSIKDQYGSGHLTQTNKPVQHVITHELAHALWNSDHKTAASRAAGKEIYNTYVNWYNDKKKKGYGSYAVTNRDEFFAEVVTKAVHGVSDKYTRRIVSIIKKHGLNKNV